MHQGFSQQALVSATKNQVSAHMTGETVIYHIPSGVYFGLDAVGDYVWELLQQSRTIREICDLVVKEYQVEREQCEHDLVAFLDALAQAELVEVKQDAIA